MPDLADRWHSLARELHETLKGYRATDEMAGMVYSAWRLSHTDVCQPLFAAEIADNPLLAERNPDARSFVDFVFWRANLLDRRNGGVTRVRIVAVLETLDDLRNTGQYVCEDIVPTDKVMWKIGVEGGVDRIYEAWRERENQRRLAKRDERRNDFSGRLTLGRATVMKQRESAQIEREDQQQLAQRFVAMLDTIGEDIAWRGDDAMMIVAAVKQPDGSVVMRRLRAPYERRMVSTILDAEQ